MKGRIEYIMAYAFAINLIAGVHWAESSQSAAVQHFGDWFGRSMPIGRSGTYTTGSLPDRVYHSLGLHVLAEGDLYIVPLWSPDLSWRLVGDVIGMDTGVWLKLMFQGSVSMMVVHVAACAAWLAASAAFLRPRWAGRAIGEGLYSARGPGLVLGLALRTFPMAVMGPVLAATAWRWAVGIDKAWNIKHIEHIREGLPYFWGASGTSIGLFGLTLVIAGGWLLHGMVVAWGIKALGRRLILAGEPVCGSCGYPSCGGPCPECGSMVVSGGGVGAVEPRYFGRRFGKAMWVVVPLMAFAGMTAPVWLAWIGAALPWEVYLKWMPY